MSDDTFEASIRIVTRATSAQDVVAVTAVVSRALAELAETGDESSGVQPSAWERSQRGVRGTLVPGAGAWRGFTG